jgi:hypothetical protein
VQTPWHVRESNVLHACCCSNDVMHPVLIAQRRRRPLWSRTSRARLCLQRPSARRRSRPSGGRRPCCHSRPLSWRDRCGPDLTCLSVCLLAVVSQPRMQPCLCLCRCADKYRCC